MNNFVNNVLAFVAAIIWLFFAGGIASVGFRIGKASLAGHSTDENVFWKKLTLVVGITLAAIIIAKEIIFAIFESMMI